MLPQTSGTKNKQRMKPARSRQQLLPVFLLGLFFNPDGQGQVFLQVGWLSMDNMVL
jgi:hypothetical protein